MRTFVLCRRIWVPFLFLCVILLSACNKHPVESKHVNVIFRFDDYSAVSNTQMEQKIINAFREHQACLTIGVIPYACAEDIHDPAVQDVIPLPLIKGDILKMGLHDGIVDVALHGYSHQTISTAQWTEFSGLEYNSQIQRLAKGKKFLEGMIDAPVNTFVPPWNRYDANTLRALETLGFSTLSADNKRRDGILSSKLNFLPYSSNLFRLRDAVKTSRISPDPQPVIVVLFHEYDFKEINEKRGRITYQEFYELLNWVTSQEDVRLLSIRQATQKLHDLSARRFLMNASPAG